MQDIRGLLLELKAQGKTILLASHNREDISVLCDTCLLYTSGAEPGHHGQLGDPVCPELAEAAVQAYEAAASGTIRDPRG